MSDDIDPEIAELLNQVDQASKPEPEPEPEPVDVASALLKTEEAALVEPVKSEDIKEFEESLSKPKDNVKDAERLSNIVQPQIEDPRTLKIRDGLFKLLENTMSTADSQMEEFTEDRKKIDEALNVLLARLTGGQPMSNGDMTALSMLLQTKTDVSANRSKYMDSIAKLFASLKKNDTIAMPNQSGDIKRDEILAILSRPKDDDDDDDDG